MKFFICLVTTVGNELVIRMSLELQSTDPTAQGPWRLVKPQRRVPSWPIFRCPEGQLRFCSLRSGSLSLAHWGAPGQKTKKLIMQPAAVNRESRLLCSEDLWEGVWIIIRVETF